MTTLDKLAKEAQGEDAVEAKRQAKLTCLKKLCEGLFSLRTAEIPDVIRDGDWWNDFHQVLKAGDWVLVSADMAVDTAACVLCVVVAAPPTDGYVHVVALTPMVGACRRDDPRPIAGQRYLG